MSPAAQRPECFGDLQLLWMTFSLEGPGLEERISDQEMLGALSLFATGTLLPHYPS